MYSDENGVQFAQSMIYNYQQELWENNWGHCPEMEGQTHIWYSDEMTHLENKLSGLGYRFMITKDGELIYSNLSDEDLEIARSVAQRRSGKGIWIPGWNMTKKMNSVRYAGILMKCVPTCRNLYSSG